jgi:hypothetical protein
MSVSRLAGEEVLPVGGAGEVLAYQPGQEQQCAAGPVVAHDPLRLPGGVAGNQGDVADRLAADPGGVVLEPAVLALRAGESELLVVIERADGHQHGPHGLRAPHEAVHRRALQSYVVGQVIQPLRVVIGELRVGIAYFSQSSGHAYRTLQDSSLLAE